MRILMVAATPYFSDRGCHVRIQGEALALEQLGCDVHIVTYGLGRDVPGGRIRRTARLPGYDRLDAAPAPGKLPLDALLLAVAVREARAARPDVVHAHTQEGGAIGLVAGRLLGIPVVVDLQSRRVAEELAHYRASPPGGLLYRLADACDRRIPRAADAVVTATSAIAEFVRAEAPPRGAVRVVGDAIDVPETAPSCDPDLLRRFGLDPARPVLVYLGLLTETQGIDLLLEAQARLRAQRPGVQLLVMGYPDEERWRARAAHLGLGDDVRFPGRIPFGEALRHVALGTLAVSPKRTTTEGNGKLLLYAAAGLPTVALDTPTNREVLGEHGLYAPDDPARFAAVLAGALADPAALERRGHALRARARTDHSWEARGLALLELYREVVAHRRERRR